MKGIVLAGGAGTRLYPLTVATSKQLLPVYDKPLIYYPLTTLMLAGLRDILLITTPHDQHAFQTLLGDGNQWGLNIRYAVQDTPRGIADAFVIGRSFLDHGPSALVLGDNIFHGDGLVGRLQATARRGTGATIFCHWVQDPQNYGVATFGDEGEIVDLHEKPASPRSNWAVTGLYFYDARIVDIAAELAPSPRGELEITDANRVYLNEGNLHVEQLGRGYMWMDAGTHVSLLEAAEFVRSAENRQGLRIACVEEVAWRMGYIDDEQLLRLAKPYQAGGYGRFLVDLLDAPKT